MPAYIPIGMRQKIEPGPRILVANTCSGNDTVELGDEARWSWSNPTNRRYPVPLFGFGLEGSAVSVECLWQGMKVVRGTENVRQTKDGVFMTKKDFLTAQRPVFEGDWKRGKGRKPVGAWFSEHQPLVDNVVLARKRIYLPAYWRQLQRMTELPVVRRMLSDAEQKYDTIYLRDFDTGYLVNSTRPLSHAYVLSQFLMNHIMEQIP